LIYETTFGKSQEKNLTESMILQIAGITFNQARNEQRKHSKTLLLIPLTYHCDGIPFLRQIFIIQGEVDGHHYHIKNIQ
jgi:hypothetical protein